MHALLLNIDFALIIEKLVLIVIVISACLVIAMYETYGERKIAAWLQDRHGPSRAGPFGLLQPLADGGKLFFKEEIIPNFSSKFLFVLGPGLAMLTAMMTSAVIPWADKVIIAGREISLQIADINIGILYVFGVVSMGVYGIMIGSWASNNKFSLIGGLRAASQMISYELPMGLALIGLLMVTGTLSLKEMVIQQQDGGWGGVLAYNFFKQPLGFFLFLVCAFAECNRTPFDLAEAENELTGGYHLEYSSMKLGFYLFAEYINMFVSGAVMATLYFGGYDIPFVNDAALPTNVAALLGVASILLKSFFFVFVFIWVRWTIPRFRYDQLMKLGWKTLIPLALLNMIVTGAIILFMQQ